MIFKAIYSVQKKCDKKNEFSRVKSFVIKKNYVLLQTK